MATERFQTSATQGFLRLPIAQRLRSDTLQRLSASAQATVMGWQRSSFVTELARLVLKKNDCNEPVLYQFLG
jgi:ABC-type proline/glycine betaine transport system substrate-binding protein